MSVAIVFSRARQGIRAPEVTIEVFLSGGLPAFSIVGLAETAVRESRDRVRSALISSGFKFPQERITVSLAPADMRKTGGRFDLALALGILVASRQLPAKSTADVEFYGELGLNGELRAVPAILPAAVQARLAGRDIIVPPANGGEAVLTGSIVRPAATLLDVAAHLRGQRIIEPLTCQEATNAPTGHPDLADIRGQARARRALEIAAAGGHNLLMIGPPGTGKSMLARRLPGILPTLSISEALETAAVESLAGQRIDTSRWRARPFRAPHHTASAVALVGGGANPTPGEISRAHNGVLFLDELPEFNRAALEALREPLESGEITISRAHAQVDYPARFQLVAAMNPCPCGYLGDQAGDCNCSRERVASYRGRISGPLLDRIDIQVEVARPDVRLLLARTPPGEPSAAVRRRVRAARELQTARAGIVNARLHGKLVDQCCNVSADAEALLERAGNEYQLSARAFSRILKVARTIADLAAASEIDSLHLGEALSLRRLDRQERGFAV